MCRDLVFLRLLKASPLRKLPCLLGLPPTNLERLLLQSLLPHISPGELPSCEPTVILTIACEVKLLLTPFIQDDTESQRSQFAWCLTASEQNRDWNPGSLQAQPALTTPLLYHVSQTCPLIGGLLTFTCWLQRIQTNPHLRQKVVKRSSWLCTDT